MNTQEIARQQSQQPAKWIERLARFGYAAKGVVYFLVGVLAFQAAFNWGGRVTGTRGAFFTIASQPLGKVMLFLVAVGLLGYVIWRFVQAAKDPEHNDEGAKAVGRRIAYAISGLIYASLAIFAFRIVFASPGSGSGGGGSSAQQAATLLSQPFGRWLLGAVGVAVVAYGFYCFYRAYSTKFKGKLKLAEMSRKEIHWATRIARFGLTAKGIVSVIIGYFIIQAARASDASEVRTTEGALQAIQQGPYGAWLMGLVALGLIAYGIHLGVQARYRRISP
jgi:NADH:ubiquinone oxidoreductase subunit 5 (subunit L)/multisubunit Na+/H+ antiporter MnhA subunit